MRRLRLLRRRLPGLQHDPDRRPRAVQRARLLGDELRRPPAHRELRVGPQQDRHRHQQPEQRRRALAAAGLVPGQHERRHSHVLPGQLHPRQQQPQRPRAPARPPSGRSARASSIAGGRGDTVRDNRFVNNGAWGVLTVPYPDTETPPPIAHCEGGLAEPPRVRLLLRRLRQRGDRQHFTRNGSFGNLTNGDIGDISGTNTPGNCWHDNSDAAGRSQSPGDLQVTHATCGVQKRRRDLIAATCCRRR